MKVISKWYEKNLQGVDMPLVILSDPAYPALPWLMKPFPEYAHTTRRQKIYNYCQSRVRMVVENAFGCLKGRWRCLLKIIDCAACVVLHNMCEMYGRRGIRSKYTSHSFLIMISLIMLSVTLTQYRVGVA